MRNKLKKSKVLKLLYTFILFIVIAVILKVGGNVFEHNKFLESAELKTYDMRFTLPIANHAIKPRKEIIILTIDDNSLEIEEETLGRWPWPRDIHGKLAEYLSQAGARFVIFDLMFLGHQKGFEREDLALAQSIKKLGNVFISMNFDNRPENNPPELLQIIKGLSLNLDNKSHMDFSHSTFSNCRVIYHELLTATKNIGIINHVRDEDGISRKNQLLLKYHDDFYPYLALKVAIAFFAQEISKPVDQFILSKSNELIFANQKVPLDEKGDFSVYWYGPAGKTYLYIPIWKVIKSMEQLNNGEEPIIPPYFFKDKIIFVGATASSLFDIKSTPFSSVHPGVEVQATILNNVMDGVYLIKASDLTNYLLVLFSCIATLIALYKIQSAFYNILTTSFIAASYFLLAIYLFKFHLLWIDIVYPLAVIMITFTVMYFIKYILKSKDFEYTYKLATTDGLTGLHNHRFFQERMEQNVQRCARYSTNFALILIDIDFFKKFNDNYGHQAGDAVLRQVAMTIKKTVRASELVARYGGEEIAVVLDTSDYEESLKVAEKLCRTVAEKPFHLSQNVTKHVTISLGVAVFPDHGDTGSALIDFADKNLYLAKENGRNQVGNFADGTVKRDESEPLSIHSPYT